MNSGNSSSTQSSSAGGEDEYDSRAGHSISPFFNHHNPNAAAVKSAIPPPSLYHCQDGFIGGSLPDPRPSPSQRPPSHIDPLLSDYFTNLDTDWSSKTVRLGSDLDGPQSEPVVFTSPASLPHMRPNSSVSVPRDGDNDNMARKPRKRSRASRRAPTTVLTTDTTNFRAMVQEFTGIPAPPFTGSSSFPRTGRFDLFGPLLNSPLPLKPFAQKLIPPSFLSSLSSSSSSSPSSSAAIIASSSSHLPSAGHQNLLNTNTIMQSIINPFLNIHSPKDPLTDPSIFTAKSKPLFDQSQSFKLSYSLDDFGHLGGLVSSSSTSALMYRNNNSDAENVEADLLRSINGGFSESIHRVSASVSGSSPGPENNVAAARNEGMVESWICSSD